MCNNQPVLLIVVTHHGIHASRSCKMQSLTKYIKIKISQPNSIFFFWEQILFSCAPVELLQVFRFDSHFILRQKLV